MRDGARALDAALDLDVARLGLLAVHGGRIGGEVPAAFLGGDIDDAAAAGFLGPAHGVHGELLDARARRGVGGEGRGDRIDGLITAQLAQQSGRNDERTAEHDRRAVDDVAHRLEFLLAVLQAAFEVGDGAAGVFEIQAHILAGLLVLLELHPAVRPEGDFLGQPLVDGGERLVDMGDAAVRDFAEVLRDERGGGEGERARSPDPRAIQGAASTSFSSGRSALGSGSRSRCGAQPAKAALPSAPDADELQALGEDVPVAGLDLVGEQEEQRRLVALVGRVHEDGALAQQVGVLLQEHVGHRRASADDRGA